jgi:copper(I)-binding protein
MSINRYNRWLYVLLLLCALALAGCGAAAGGGAASGPEVASADKTILVSGAWARLPGGAIQAQPAAMDPMTATSEAHAGTAGAEDTGGVGAAYMTIRSSAAAADRLLKVEGDVASSIELHTMTDTGGVMAMRPVDGVEIPAGGEVALKPGSLHVMMIGLRRSLKPGDKIDLRLTFEKAGLVNVQAEVRTQ